MALYKRGNESKCSLKKEQCEWCSRDSSKLLAKNQWFAKNCFFHRFLTFSPLFMNRFCCSSLIRSFVISDLSNLLLSLFTKVCPWAIRSGCSCQKRGRAIYRKVENCQKQMKNFWGLIALFFKQFAQIRSESLTLLFFKEHQEQIAHNPSVVKSAMSILLFCKE